MARYTGASCRLCRRENLKLFLKGDRCYGDKCAFERRPYAPGQHGQRRGGKVSDYQLQLREKQKVKRIYGVLERQFRKYYFFAEKKKGITGTNLLILLECRLDNVVYRLGIAPTRAAARQLVSHRHITVNGQIVNIPSFQVKPDMIVSVREKSKSLEVITSSLTNTSVHKYSWLEWDQNTLTGKFLTMPERSDIPENIKEQLIVELYSK